MILLEKSLLSRVLSISKDACAEVQIEELQTCHVMTILAAPVLLDNSFASQPIRDASRLETSVCL